MVKSYWTILLIALLPNAVCESSSAQDTTMQLERIRMAIRRVNSRLPRGIPKKYAKLIIREARRVKIDPWLVFSVAATESAFRAAARGPVGEVGLMQLRPKFFAPRALNKRGQVGYLQDPENNIRIAAKYISELKDKFRGRYRGIRFIEHYNRGAYCKVKTFRYSKKVEKFYSMATGAR